MTNLEKKTCVRFKDITSDSNELQSKPNYIEFFSGNGCYSYVGMTGRYYMKDKKQQISLGKGCVDFGRASHEIIHALGFDHTQSRSDRDDWVKINSENIESGKEHNFKKLDISLYDNQGTPYDFLSVMHYDRSAFNNWFWQDTVTVINSPELMKARAEASHRPANEWWKPGWSPEMEKQELERLTSLIGQRGSVSEGDIERINKLYNCSP